MNAASGRIVRISGPVVTVAGLAPAMYEVVTVGRERLLGEVIQLRGEHAIVQVYEDTTGLRPDEPAERTGASLSVELGPGLLGCMYDGIQRPLQALADGMGDFIRRGLSVSGLDHERRWAFVPAVKEGDAVSAGSILGRVQETEMIEHRILVPPDLPPSRVISARAGEFTIDEIVCRLQELPASGGRRGGVPRTFDVRMLQKWPVRIPRPAGQRLPTSEPLVTGQRVIDSLFPLAKGGTAAIPGPFGSGKTVTQQQLARWSNARIVVYVGCGERGNEMTEVLQEFPALKDPHTGRPLMERTILVANTSNMPVAAREASVYTGITLAEYYRDMGYDVALMADSTSRWAEAMREISSRLEEMPGEEGYPAYLATRLSQFYERAGSFRTIGGSAGSITVIGAVSPPGGDFSEPVTQNTLRIAKVFFALDSKLAQRRHFPSIHWLNSYSLYADTLAPWYRENAAKEFPEWRRTAVAILQKESELQDVIQLVGADALPDHERLVLETARLLREVFLQQNAYHAVDAFTPLEAQALLLRAILRFHSEATAALKAGAPLRGLLSIPSLPLLARARFEADRVALFTKLVESIAAEARALVPAVATAGGAS